MFQQKCKCDADTPGCCVGGWQTILCDSRHLTECESRYAAVEGEALAVAWCFKKAKTYLLGCPEFMVVVDHKPLLPIFQDKSLSDIDNPRLLRFKEKTLPFSFKMKHIKGRKCLLPIHSLDIQFTDQIRTMMN